jgi:hypothetical protein
MKKLLTTILVVLLGAAACLAAEGAKIAGKWQLTMDTPHGAMQGSLTLQQDGPKITGTCDMQHIGSLSLTGKLDDNKLSLNMEVPDNQMKVAITGTVDGNKMTGTTEFGNWSATRQ